MADSCTDTIALENLDFCANQENTPGVSPTAIYGCPVSEFATIAALAAKDVATTLEEAATISESHTFDVGKGFFKIQILPQTGMVESPEEGEIGNKATTNNFAFTLPGVSARNKGFVRKYKNVPMIWLVPQLNGDTVQLGSEKSPAYVSEATPSTGTKAGDVIGIPMKITDIADCAAPVYSGTITEFTPA